MSSQDTTGQRSQPQETPTDNDEEIKISSESIDQLIENLLQENGYESIAQVLEELEDAKERIIKCAKRPKQLQTAKEDVDQLEGILQKHAQLVQPKIQKLLDDYGLDNVDEAIAEKLLLDQKLRTLPQTSVKQRKNCQEDLDKIDEILRIANRQNPKPQTEPQPQPVKLPEIGSDKIFSDQEKKPAKIDPDPNIKPVQQMNQVEPESLFQREKQDAEDHAGLIKSAPDSFEKSVKLLTHILYQKLDNNISPFDKVLGVPTAKYNELIHDYLTKIQETYVSEVIKNNEITTKVNSLQHPNGENVQQFETILNCLKQIQTLTCRFNFQEFFAYVGKADEVSKSLANSNKCIVLLLGTTGAGKSTTIHYMCGSEMYETQNNGLKHIAFGTVLNQDLINVKVSPFARSETRYIKPIKIDMKQLGARTQEQITLVDTPGLFDLKNAEVDVSNQIGIVKALSQVESIRPFIVFSYKRLGARGEGLKEILNFYAQMIVDSRKITYFNFFFSHVDKEVKMENLKAKIIDILDQLNPKEKLNDRLVKFLQVIIERADENKLFIIDPLNKSQVLKILKEVLETEAIDRPSSVFQKVICDESSQKIIEQFDLHAKAIRSAFKKAEGIRVEFMLSELKKFCEIMDSNQDYKQRLNDILKQLNQILSNKYDEVVSMFQKQLLPGNKISDQEINKYKSNVQFSFSVDSVREKFLCDIDGGPNMTRSYQDTEQEVERLIDQAKPPVAKLDQQNLQEYIQKLDILANSQIESFVSIRNKYVSNITEQLNGKYTSATEILGKIMTLEQVLPNEHQNQIVMKMSQNDDEEVKVHFEEQKKMPDSLLDQFGTLMRELEKAHQITKNQTLKEEIRQRNDSIVSFLKKKFEEMNTQYFSEIQRINLQNMNNFSNLPDEELNSQADIQMNKSKVELIQRYYNFLETFIGSTTSNNLSQGFIGQIEGRLTQLNDKMIVWYSVQEEKLKRKISQDRKYSAIKSIYDEIMLVKDLPALKGQTMRQNRIKMNLTKLVKDKSDEAKKYIGQIQKLVNQQQVEESKSKEYQQINFYTLVSLKEAIGTIKDLKWTIENGNEYIYDDLKDDLKSNLLLLVILIEENVKKTREDTANANNIGGTEQAFKQISEIQSIAQIINIELPDINVQDFIPEIESNLNGCEKFLTSKEVPNINEEQKTDLITSVYLLRKQECDKFFTNYTYFDKIRKNDFMIKRIDEITSKNPLQKRNFSERVKNLHEKLEEFIRSHMEQVDKEFQKQLNLMKQYLNKIQTLSRNEDGFYDNEDHQNKASQYLDDYLVNPVDVILGIFKMIRELKQNKYQQLWNKLSQNEDYEENFKLEILKFYRVVDEGIARARSDQVQITNSLKIINQLIPLDLYVNVNEQNEQEKGAKLFQAKYDEHFKSLCNFHDQVVNMVEDYIKKQKYDEIKENLITLQQLDSKDQQSNLRKVKQILMQKCTDLTSQIIKDIRFLLRDKQLDANKTGELNKKSTELQEILDKIGERFLSKSVYDKGKSALENFQKQISSNFEKIKQCINDQIENNNFSEAYDSLINFQNSARNIDMIPLPQTSTGDQIQVQKDFYDETTQLHNHLIKSIDQKVEEFKILIKESLKQKDDQILEQIKERSPRDIIENLQKSKNQELLNYAQKIIDAIRQMFQDKITSLEQKVGKKGQNAQEIQDQINDYSKFCTNFPQNLNEQFKQNIENIKITYLKEQEKESNETIDLIQTKQSDKSYIELIFNRISQASFALDKKCLSRFHDFYNQACGRVLNQIQTKNIKGIEENLFQLWKFQSSSVIQSYLDESANNSFQEIQKLIQEIYKQITDMMSALFSGREIQKSIDIHLFDWFHILFTHKNYQNKFANELIPNAGETLLKVIELGIQEVKKCQSEFSCLINENDLTKLSEIFSIIQKMKEIQIVQNKLIHEDSKILLENSQPAGQKSAEKYKEFVKLSQIANKDKYSEQIANRYKQIEMKAIKDSTFFTADKSQSQLDIQDLKIQHENYAKYLTFVEKSQSVQQDLRQLKIDTVKQQKDQQEKISNYYNQSCQQVRDLLKNLQPSKLELINNLLEDIFITETSFKTYIKFEDNFRDIKAFGISIVNQLRGKIGKDAKSPESIADLLIKLQNISQNVKQFKECAQQQIQEALDWMIKNINDQTITSQVANLLKKSPIGLIIVEQQQVFICEARTFWASRIDSQEIGFVLDNVQKNNGSLLSNNEKQNLKTQYDLYLNKYTKLVEDNIFPQENIPGNMMQIKIKLLEITQIYKQKKIDNRALDKIYDILACLFALWTLSDFHKNKLQYDKSKKLAIPYLLKPHPAQVISILRILGQGYDQIVQQDQIKLNPTKTALLQKYADKDSLFDNLVQIKTGEGKSITLAVVISVFALWDFEVSCACYSQYLSQRDFKQFKHLFEFLNINEKIFYGTFNQICENYINKDGKIRDIMLNRILKDSNIQIKPMAQAAKRVILIDEVDVFFGSEFFNKMYVPVTQIKHPKVSSLLDYIWENRTSKFFAFKKLQLSNEYNECKALFKQEYAGILDEACKEMYSAAQNFLNHDYVVQDQKIGYHEMEQVSFTKSFGYNTIFAHYYHEKTPKDGQKVSKQNLDASKSLEIQCGQFSYAEIPLYSMLILGVTGTLDSLSASEKSIINDVFQIRNFTYSPSVYGQNKLIWKDLPRYERTIILNKQDYFMDLTNEIKKKMALNNSQRSVIVFFKSLDLLKEFKNSKNYTQLSCQKQELTEMLDDSDKESKIIKATYKNTLTLTTRSFGRGTDFICRDEAVEANGGVHVILTFVPEMNSEFVQIQGRTARQGNSGSFQMILLDSDLSQFDIDVGSQEYQDELKDKLDFIFKKRDKVMLVKQQSDAKAVNEIKARHQEAIEIKDILVQNNGSNSAIISKYLIKINKGPSIQENQNPVKTLILMDATGSMSSFLQQAKNSVNQMYERSGNILTAQGLEPQLNLIQYACYRNYSSENLILQNSPWQSKADQLKAFMDSVTVSGGMGNEAVEIGFQHAVREAQNFGNIPLRQVYLIGDMPPNTKQEVDSRRDKYQFWKNSSKFNEPAYWETELAKLKQLKVQVNTFYVNTSAKSSFEDIAKRTGGTCTYLDLSKPDSQENLLQLFLQNIFQMIGQAAGDTKIGDKMVADYLRRYK